jgi:hypothetical protein
VKQGIAVVVALMTASSAGLSRQALRPVSPPTITLVRTFVIGTALRGDNDLFGELSGARKLASGDIVAADDKADQLKLFDSAGHFVRIIGKDGDGPGDFRSVARLLPAGGDTIMVYDGIAGRVTGLDRKGTVLLLYKVAQPAPVPDPTSKRQPGSAWREMIGRFGNGHLLSSYRFAWITGPSSPSEIHSDTVAIDLSDQATSVRIGAVHGGETYRYRGGRSTFGGDVPFAPIAYLAVGRSSWFYAGGASGNIEQRDQRGKLQGTLHLALPSVSVTATDIANYRQQIIGHAGGPNAAELRSLYQGAADWLRYPAVMPVLDGLAVDDAGNVWARRFRNDTLPHDWYVVSPAGTAVGIATLRSSCRPTQITRAVLLATCTGDDDAPTVEMYRIVTPATR